MNDSKKKKILQIAIIAVVIIAVIGVVVWRNSYGRRERVKVFLIKSAPTLGDSDIWHIEEYSENSSTSWRVRKYKTSGVIKSSQPLFALKGMYEPREGDPFSFVIYHFETIREMSSGVPFEIDFDTASDSPNRTKLSFPIPKFYTARDLKELCSKGIVVQDDDILPGSFMKSQDLGKFAEQLDLQFKVLEKEISRIEALLKTDPADIPFDEKEETLRRIANEERDIRGRLALLTVANRICRNEAALNDYAARSLQHMVKFQSMLTRLGEFKRGIHVPKRAVSFATPTEAAGGAQNAATAPATAAPAAATPAADAQQTASEVQQSASSAPERAKTQEPEKALPAMVPAADARTLAWAKLHRPDLYDRYTKYYEACGKKQKYELMEDAILKYNEVCQQIIAEKTEYYSNPVKQKDLSPEMLEFAESEFPEYHQEYRSAKTSIRNRRIIYNKALNDRAPKGRLDQHQAKINEAIVRFNDARQKIINAYQKK